MVFRRNYYGYNEIYLRRNMNVYLVTPAPEPTIEMSQTGELIALGLIVVCVISFFGFAKKVLDTEDKIHSKYRLH